MEMSENQKTKRASGKKRSDLPKSIRKFAKMTEEEYRSHSAVNKSTLWEIRKSPAHYKYALEHPGKDTPALKLGRAIHMAILQPDDFNKHYALAPGFDRRTKSGKEMYEQFMATHGGMELINQDDYDMIIGMYESVWNDPAASKLLTGCRFETPMFWTDEATGIECKCRLDAHKETESLGIVIDLKTCADASTATFMRESLRYGYDVQTAHYLRGYRMVFDRPADFYFIAVEKTPPYAVNVIRATDGFIDRGTWQLIDMMDKLADCRRTDNWPGYGENELVLPEWASIPDGDE
jgi:hypothetical protein